MGFKAKMMNLESHEFKKQIVSFLDGTRIIINITK